MTLTANKLTVNTQKARKTSTIKGFVFAVVVLCCVDAVGVETNSLCSSTVEHRNALPAMVGSSPTAGSTLTYGGKEPLHLNAGQSSDEIDCGLLSSTTHHRTKLELKLSWTPSQPEGSVYGYYLCKYAVYEGGDISYTAVEDTEAWTRLDWNEPTVFYVIPLWYDGEPYYPSVSATSDTYIWDSNPLSIERDGDCVVLSWPREWYDDILWIEESTNLVSWSAIKTIYQGTEWRVLVEGKRKFYRVRSDR